MQLNLSQIIFVFTLFFAFDLSAEQKIPLLEKDLYLKGLKLSRNAGSNNYSAYNLLIHIYNDYDEKTRDLIQKCEERYKDHLEQFGKKSADSVIPKVLPECRQVFNKSEVLSDVYVYVIDQNINRNEFRKLTKCETRYYGDGNEFIEIRETDCRHFYEKKNGSVQLDRILIQRDNLLATLSISWKDDPKIEMKFLSKEEYKETYQQLDDKHQAYVKEINEKSLL